MKRYDVLVRILVAATSLATGGMAAAAPTSRIYVAHRGDYALAMEATMPAYRRAVELGAEAVKLDVHPTKDGVPVLCHDRSLNRNMGWDVEIPDVTLAEIRKHVYLSSATALATGNADLWFTDGVPSRECLVTLAEALEVVKGIPGFWVDFKTFNTNFADRVFAEFRAAGIAPDRITVATFTLPALDYVRKAYPQVRRVSHVSFLPRNGKLQPSYRTEPLADACELVPSLLAHARSHGLHGVNIDVEQNPEPVTPDVIDELKRHGLFVSLAVINTEKLARRFAGCAHDAVVTGRRETVKTVFDRHVGPFADGDRVVFLGDSLTQGGRYHRIIADWYLTHFPERDIKFFDAGVGGDSAKYCAPRFASDVVRPKPTVVAVMFGSNDAGFRTLPEFTADMTNLSDRIARECGNPKTVWITSTPYDEYSVREPKGRKGYDARMRVLEEAVRTTTEHAKGDYCEFGDPMRDYMAWKRWTDPSFSLMPDRDHPKEPGHLIMAWLFLKAQGVPSLVSEVSVDAKTLRAAARNADIGAVRKTDSGALSFEVTERSLPMPFHEETRSVRADLPIANDLSREIVRISGLGYGWWALVIDGDQVVEADAADWAKGVDIGGMDTPQMRQAKRVAERNAESRRVYARYRRFVAMRWWTQWSPAIVKHPEDEENYSDLRALWRECERTGDTNNYYNCVMPQYWDYWPRRAEELKRVDALYESARREARPVKRMWRIENR